MNILCAADFHIGRTSSRIPARLNAGEFSAAQGWLNLVDLALTRQVDLVLLAGDIVDWDNRFFEAYGPLESGVRRLLQSGIPVWAVAGNHDVEVLPRMAKLLEGQGFRLLGQGGSWERAEFVGADGTRLTVDGWSFPQREVTESPLLSYGLPTVSHGYHVGLVHGEMGASSGRYAPIPRSLLTSHAVPLWVVGHHHGYSIQDLSPTAKVLIPGSVTALDPGEPGVHGAWMLNLTSTALASLQHIPLSACRYEAVELDLTDHSSADEFEERAAIEIGLRVDERLGIDDPCQVVLVRLSLVGRIPFGRELQARLPQISGLELNTNTGVTVHIEKVTDRTRGERDLLSLSRDPVSPAGWLARLLLALEEGTPTKEFDPTLFALAERIRGVATAVPYKALQERVPVPDEEQVRDLSRDTAAHLLDELLEQGGAS